MPKGGNNSAKTRCPYGHEYTDENVRINAQGARVCRTCYDPSLLRKRAQRAEAALRQIDDRLSEHPEGYADGWLYGIIQEVLHYDATHSTATGDKS